MLHIRPITNIVGIQLIIVGILMLSTLPFSFYYRDGDHYPLIAAGLITLLTGILTRFYRQKDSTAVKKREGFIIVVFGWLIMVSFSMLPYLFSGVIPSVSDAFFETMSGMTTTGATILTDIEVVPRGILFWRSMTQWIGGMGIIVLTVAIFPLLGFGGIELFVAEAPGPTSEKVHPRISETAKRLWLLYVLFTTVLMLLLFWGGMSFYDAINHALTTMATGGFSTKNASIAAFPQAHLQYTICFFMLIAGTNYTILYFFFKGRFRKVWKSEEFKAYLFLIVFLGVVVSSTRFLYGGVDGLEQSVREGLFQVLSLVTTTGFVSADYSQWGNGLQAILFFLLFMGACAGSTSGGIKVVRHLVFFRNTYLEFNRMLHHKAIIPIKLDGQAIRSRIATHILVFLLLYLMTCVIGVIVSCLLGLDLMTAIGAVATSVGNVGPGIGNVGPVDNFAWLSAPIKWWLSFLMLLGRLELFTVLVLFTPYYWRMA